LGEMEVRGCRVGEVRGWRVGEGRGAERALGGAMVADCLQGASLSTSVSTMEEARVSTTAFPCSLEPLHPKQHSNPILLQSPDFAAGEKEVTLS